MTKDNLQYVVSMLQDTNLKAVAQKVNLSYRTVWGIANSTNTNPTSDTVRKLVNYFREKSRG